MVPLVDEEVEETVFVFVDQRKLSQDISKLLQWVELSNFSTLSLPTAANLITLILNIEVKGRR